MTSLFERLREGGYAALEEEMLVAQAEESLLLEFKTLHDHTSPDLTRDDRKLLAKAACGMSNADGGTIVVGVRTSKPDGVDIATEIRPLVRPDTIRSRIAALLAEALSPPNAGIDVIALPAPDGTGVIAVHVPPSDQRPHMAIAEHRYFRRGSDGTRVMEHSEVRDAMLAERAGRLAVSFAVGGRGYSSSHVRAAIEIIVENVGTVPVWAPYLIVDIPEASPFRSDGFIARQTATKGMGFYGGRDMMIPPNDSIALAQVPVGIALHEAVPRDADSAESFLLQKPHLVAFSYSQTSFLAISTNRKIFEKFHDFSVVYGGANAIQQQRKLDLSRGSIRKQLLRIRSSG